MSDSHTEEHYFTGGETVLERDELACRLMEIAIGLKRPAGQSTASALDFGERACLATGAPFVFREMADVALAYLVERMTAGQGTLQ